MYVFMVLFIVRCVVLCCTVLWMVERARTRFVYVPSTYFLSPCVYIFDSHVSSHVVSRSFVRSIAFYLGSHSGILSVINVCICRSRRCCCCCYCSSVSTKTTTMMMMTTPSPPHEAAVAATDTDYFIS